MSASFVSAMNTRANHFAIDEENKQLKAELAMLLKEKEQLKKELEKATEENYRMCEIAQANDWDIYPSGSDEESEEESEEESDEDEEETPPPPKVKLNGSPNALKYARDNSIDLTDFVGSGEDGKIMLKDVKALECHRDAELGWWVGRVMTTNNARA